MRYIPAVIDYGAKRARSNRESLVVSPRRGRKSDVAYVDRHPEDWFGSAAERGAIRQRLANAFKPGWTERLTGVQKREVRGGGDVSTYRSDDIVICNDCLRFA